MGAAKPPPPERFGGVGGPSKLPDGDGATAEIALVVRDDAQGQGIGGLLLRRLVQIAQAIGVTRLRGDLLAENHTMVRLLRSLGLPYVATTHSGTMQVTVRVSRGEELLGRAMQRRAPRANLVTIA